MGSTQLVSASASMACNVRSLALALALALALVSCAFPRDSAKVDTYEPQPLPPAVPLAELRSNPDSVTATPGRTYDAGPLQRFFLGNLNRHVWRIPFRVEVLDINKFAGGLQPLELSGGRQTLGLRFLGADGNTYQFRSLVKDPRSAVPPHLRFSPAAAIVNDQMAAQFPLAPLVVSEIAEAAGVLFAKPRLVVLPDDEKLGKFRETFAGRMGWIEIRPEGADDEGPGFAGASRIIDTEDLHAELLGNQNASVDARALLRARLVDFLVGDWDRHSDQWRWAEYNDDARNLWVPIPRDRDWAFAHTGGAITLLAPWLMPQYVSFSERYPGIRRLSWSGRRIDRNLLTRLDRKEFMAIAAEVSARITDDVLRRAVGVVPEQYKAEGDRILKSLRTRRDNLTVLASEFYELLAREPVIRGTAAADSATITSAIDSIRIDLHSAGPNRHRLLFSRTFHRGETKEVRLYLLDGDDRLVVRGADSLPIRLRIFEGSDEDSRAHVVRGGNIRISYGATDERIPAEVLLFRPTAEAHVDSTPSRAY